MTRRIEHIFENKEEKKRCCSCQTYHPLTIFNPCKATWDKLRPTCKACLHLKRMANRKQMTKYNKKYWKKTQGFQKIRRQKWRKNNEKWRKIGKNSKIIMCPRSKYVKKVVKIRVFVKKNRVS